MGVDLAVVRENESESVLRKLVREYVEKNWHSGVIGSACEYVQRLTICEQDRKSELVEQAGMSYMIKHVHILTAMHSCWS